MADVHIPMRGAKGVALPPVCAISGERADGAVSIRSRRSWTRPRRHTMQVPLSDRVFTKWARRQNIHIKARVLAAVLASLAVAVAFRNGLVAIALLAASGVVHVLDLRAERAAASLRPSLDAEDGDLVLRGVHDAFAAAVAAQQVDD